MTQQSLERCSLQPAPSGVQGPSAQLDVQVGPHHVSNDSSWPWLVVSASLWCQWSSCIAQSPGHSLLSMRLVQLERSKPKTIQPRSGEQVRSHDIAPPGPHCRKTLSSKARPKGNFLRGPQVAYDGPYNRLCVRGLSLNFFHVRQGIWPTGH